MQPDNPSTTTSPIAQLSHVTLRYEHGVCALDDLSLSIRKGERLCVLGANGSGKSTLASVLSGLLAPDEGTVELAGHPVLTAGEIDFDAYRAARRELGLVFQNPDDQIVTSVVQDDVAFGPENLGLPPEEITRRVHRELHRVALDAYATADPSKLSGGQQQRVAIAGALAMEPQLLVLDEPGALLDVRGRRSIMRVMRRLHQAGTTLVHITHFMDEALEADRVIVMAHGRIALEGTPDQVFAHANELGSLGLEEPLALQLARELMARGVAVPLTTNKAQLKASIEKHLQGGRDAMNEGEGTASESKATAKTGKREVSDTPRVEGSREAQSDALRTESSHGTQSDDPHARGERSVATTPDPATHNATPAERPSSAGQRNPLALQVSHVSYGYGNLDAAGKPRLALDDVSFSVPAGTTAAIVGQTGSGKSTLLRIVCALEQPDSGTVLVDGINTANKRDRGLIHGHVGYVMQHPERQLFAETVQADVAYGPTNMGLSGKELHERVAHALELVGLSGKAEASPFELSGGQKRLCAIAGILAMEPSILVLDEPTAGLDPRGRRQLHAILDRIHASGVTVVQVTHSMEDAAHTDRVIVLNQSHVLATGSPRSVFAACNAPKLEAAGLGLPQPLAWANELDPQGTVLHEPLTLEELAGGIAVASGTPKSSSQQKGSASPHASASQRRA